ncbi:MAG: hypothetical protein DMG47_17625 [Acidobacteria bacterium]|nr:MAG: hypothetical protein DMG47_17625 [Acidobacteriota bacterium]
MSSKEILMNTICCRVAQIAFVCAVLSLVGLEAQAQTYVFGNASYSAPGLSSASSLVIADFNADGIPDAAMLGTISSGQVLSIFLGKPDGSFGPRVDYSVQASGFTVGDFNGDGKVDVIVVSSTGASIFFWERRRNPPTSRLTEPEHRQRLFSGSFRRFQRRREVGPASCGPRKRRHDCRASRERRRDFPGSGHLHRAGRFLPRPGRLQR